MKHGDTRKNEKNSHKDTDTGTGARRNTNNHTAIGIGTDTKSQKPTQTQTQTHSESMETLQNTHAKETIQTVTQKRHRPTPRHRVTIGWSSTGRGTQTS